MEYYQKAINIVKKEFHDPFFFIFSDDIEWVKENLKLDTNNVLFIDWNKGNDSVYDMFLMSKAKANIIANSTFSFWGAFLNEESKITVCPRKWFNQGFKDPDIIPESWIRI